MTEPTEVIGVLRMHLQEMQGALEIASGYLTAMDLADGYRTIAPAPRISRSAALMAKALSHVEGYLSVTEDDNVG